MSVIVPGKQIPKQQPALYSIRYSLEMRPKSKYYMRVHVYDEVPEAVKKCLQINIIKFYHYSHLK